MTRPSWGDGQEEKRLSRREIIQQLLLIVDALKRMEAKNISGLEARPGFEASWSTWVQCAEWLRSMQQEAESTPGTAGRQTKS